MRFLFAAHPTVGHTQALKAVGRELSSRGHRVDFAITDVPKLPAFLPTPEPLRAAHGVLESLEREGFTLVRTPASLKSAFAASRIARTRGYDELSWACRLFTVDALAAARVMLAHLQRNPCEVVVADYAFFGAWLAAEVAGLPFVAVYHSGLPFPAEGQPPFGSGLPASSPPASWVEAQRRLDALSLQVDTALAGPRKVLGLSAAPPGVLSRPYARGLNAITSFEAMELSRPHLAAEAAGPVLWAGPCLGTMKAGDFDWAALEGPRPLVYVSLGTVFNDQPALYRTLLEGVHHAGARAVVSAGASIDAVKAVARADDVVCRFVPQVAVLEKVGAFVSHGGNNSTNEALRAGTPLVLVPFGGEQIANAQRAEALGVGSWLQASSLNAERVAGAVRAALTDERRARSRALAERLPRGDGAVRVAEAIVQLRGLP